MKEILLETQFLPPLFTFAQMSKATVIWLEAKENYQKGSYRNRCYIAGANGVQLLSIPLEKGKSRNKNIQEVKIAYHRNWQNEHQQSIKSAYGNAPFFEYYSPALLDCLMQKPATLWLYNFSFLKVIFEILGWEKEIRLTQDYIPNVEMKDLRNQIIPKKANNFPSSFFYPQVFEEVHGFVPNLSILDLIFCTGPESTLYLSTLSKTCDI